MPELPEVERARALIETRALGREIVEVDDSDTYVCRPHAPGEIADGLTGRRLIGAYRRGKSMWCETDHGPALGLHLGMAGRIVVDEAQAGDPNTDPRLAEPQCSGSGSPPALTSRGDRGIEMLNVGRVGGRRRLSRRCAPR